MMLTSVLAPALAPAGPYYEYRSIAHAGVDIDRIVTNGSVNDYGDIVFYGYDSALADYPGGSHVIAVARTGERLLLNGRPCVIGGVERVCTDAYGGGPEPVALTNNQGAVLVLSADKNIHLATTVARRWVAYSDVSLFRGGAGSNTYVAGSSWSSEPDPGTPRDAFEPDLMSGYFAMSDSGTWVHAGGFGDEERADKFAFPQLGFITKTFAQDAHTAGDRTTILGTAALAPPDIDWLSSDNGQIENLRPAIADDGSVMIREGVDEGAPVSVFLPDGTRVELANTSGGSLFSDLYESVALSGSARVAVFAGRTRDDGDGHGDGIFLSVRDGLGPGVGDFFGPGSGGRFINVVGEQYEDLGFGEIRSGPPCNPRGICFSAFDFEEGLFVQHFENAGPADLPGTDDGLAHDSVVIAFFARPIAEKILYPGVAPSPTLYSDEVGLWTVRIDLPPDPDTGEIVPLVHSPVPVVQVGDVLDGLLVAEIDVLDPLAKALTDSAGLARTHLGRADHRIAFVISNVVGNRKLMTAESFDTDDDGLFDHWEETGVDMTGNGVVDLDLPALGADPLHKDVFLQIDFLGDRRTGPTSGYTHDLAPGVTERLVDVFAGAPVENPDGTLGIRLHVDAGLGEDDDGTPYSNVPEEMAWGGHYVGMEEDEAIPVDYVYHGFEEHEEQIGGLNARSMESIQAKTFGKGDARGRELAFHHAILSDFHSPYYRATGAGPDDSVRRPHVFSAEASRSDQLIELQNEIPNSAPYRGGFKIISGSLRGHTGEYVRSGTHGLLAYDPLPGDLSAGDLVVLFNGWSGETEWASWYGLGTRPTNDLIVSLRVGGLSSGRVGNTSMQVGTLLHELGHTLGRIHCGTLEDDAPCINSLGRVHGTLPDGRVLIEGGQSARLSVFLNAAPENSVTVAIASSDRNLVIDPPTVTIAPGAWDTGAEVLLSYPEDSGTPAAPVRNANVELTTTSLDGRFLGAWTETTIALFDNDVGELVYLDYGVARPAEDLSSSLAGARAASGAKLHAYIRVDGEPIVEGEGRRPIDVQLSRAPAGAVTVDFEHVGTHVSPASLIFLPENWDTPQTLQVGVDDDDDERAYLRARFNNASGDPYFRGDAGLLYSPRHVEDDRLEIIVEGPAYTALLDEEARPDETTMAFVRLSQDPGASGYRVVIVPGSGMWAGADPPAYDALTRSLVFDTANWQDPQVVTIGMLDNGASAGLRRRVVRFVGQGDDRTSMARLPILTIDRDPLQTDHESVMSYAHQLPPRQILDYAGPADARADEWSYLRTNPSQTMPALGHSTREEDAEPRELGLDLETYEEIHGRLPDVEGPELAMSSPRPGSELSLGAPFECRIEANDEIAAVDEVRCEFDADGSGVVDASERVVLVQDGFRSFVSTMPPVGGSAGAREITLVGIDAESNRSTARIPVFVRATNQQPVADGRSLVVGIDTPRSLLLSGSDPESAPITFSIVAPPGSGSLSGTAPDVVYTPAPGFEGFDSFSFRVSDGRLDSAPATISVMVGEANTAPVLDAIPDIGVLVGSARGQAISATDADGHPIRFSLDRAPSFVSLVDNGDGTARILVAPGLGSGGTYSAILTATDGWNTSTRSFTITARDSTTYNAPPFIAPIADQNVVVGTAVEVPISATDEEGDPIVLLGGAGNPSFVTVVNEGPGAGRLLIDPGIDDVGHHVVTVRASDGLLILSRFLFVEVFEPDTTAPSLLGAFPMHGDRVAPGIDNAWVLFSEPIDVASALPEDLMVTTAGGIPVAGADVTWLGENRVAVPSFDPLAVGAYELTVADGVLADPSGNTSGTPATSNRFDVVASVASGDPRPDTQLVLPVEYAAKSADVGDVDGDGIPDVVVGHGSDGANGLSVFRGLGGGAFAAPIAVSLEDGDLLELAHEHRALPIGVADLDGDGRDEIVAGLETTLSVVTSGLAGELVGPTNYDLSGFGPIGIPDQIRDLEIADVNGDGHADVLSSLYDDLLVQLGDGAGGLGAPIQHSSGTASGRRKSLATGDLDADGILDVVDGPNVFLGAGDGTFTSVPNSFDAGFIAALYEDLAIADIDGDGILDVIGRSAAGSDRILRASLGNGDGTFHTIGTGGVLEWNILEVPIPGHSIWNLVVSDVDGDGDPDFSISYRSDRTGNDEFEVGVFLNTGSGVFVESDLLTTTQDHHATVLADLDQDGLLDLGSLGGDGFSYQPGSAAGQFTSFRVAEFDQAGAGAVGDIDGDGDDDVVAGGTLGQAHIRFNSGDGTFTPGPSLDFFRHLTSFALGIESMALEDLDEDGDADVVVAGYNTVAIRLSNGDGTFGSAVTHPVAGRDDLLFRDLDGDGFDEIVAVDRSSYAVLLSNGDGSFRASAHATHYLNGRSATALEDTTGDGLLDLVWSNDASNSVSILEGLGDGSFVPTSDPLYRAVDVAVDTLGNLYVVDGEGARMQKYDAAGVLVASFGEFGSGVGALSRPSSVALDSAGHVFVLDDYDHRIVDYDSNGVYVSSFGTLGSGPGQLFEPSAIAIASDDSIFVADTGNFRIQKFDADGNYVAQFGNTGPVDVPGNLARPEAIAVSAAGEVHVLDLNYTYPNSSILQIYDANGNYLRQHPILGVDPAPLIHRPVGLALDAAGDVFISEGGAWNDVHRVQRFDGSGALVQSFGSYGSLLGQLDGPAGLAVDASGNVLVATHQGVQRFAPTGEGIDFVGVDLRVAGGPQGIAIGDVDEDGTLDLVTSNRAGVTRDPFGDVPRREDSGGHSISVLFGNPDGSYDAHYNCAVGRDPIRPVLDDFDGDGRLDVAVASGPDHSVTILRGGPGGRFSHRADFRVDDRPVGLAGGRLDADGLLDVVTTSSDAATLTTLMSDATVWETATPADCTLDPEPPVGGSGSLIADAGPDAVVVSGDVAILDGGGSLGTTPEAVLAFAWTQTSGPPVELIGGNGRSPLFTTSALGRIELLLTATEGALEDTDVVAIDVVAAPAVNSPPVADAGLDQTAPRGSLVTLDGTASSDPDADPLTYAWRIVGAPTGSAATITDLTASAPSFVLDERGTYLVELVVADGEASSVPDVVTLEATGNFAPIAVADGSPEIFLPGAALLNGLGSFDTDGDPITHAWRLASAPAGSAATIFDPTAPITSALLDVAGLYVFELVVNDGLVDSAASSFAVEAIGNRAPTANAGPDSTVELPGAARLDGSRSLDPDGDPLRYAWSLVSSPAGSATFPVRGGRPGEGILTTDLPGTYVVELIVSDGLNTSEPDRVTIVASGDDAPIANAGSSRSILAPGTVGLDGSASLDPEGQPLTYLWSLVSAPAGSATAIGAATTVAPTLSTDVPGAYIVQLVVNDGAQPSVPSLVTITATTNAPPVAAAGPDQRVALGAGVALDASASLDPDGGPLPVRHRWDFTSLPAASLLEVDGFAAPNQVRSSFTPDVAGRYLVRLTVNDGRDQDSDEVEIVVEDLTPIPVISDLTARAKDGKVDLVWTPADGALYNIYRSEIAGGPYEVIARAHASHYATYADLGLTNGVTYHYVVTVVLGSSESASSNPVSARPSARGGRGDGAAPVPEPSASLGLIVGLAFLAVLCRAREPRTGRVSEA